MYYNGKTALLPFFCPFVGLFGQDKHLIPIGAIEPTFGEYERMYETRKNDTSSQGSEFC